VNGSALDPDETSRSLRGFTSIHSQIYRQLGDHFECAYDDWFENPPWQEDRPKEAELED
jgi:hypothetical protein